MNMDKELLRRVRFCGGAELRLTAAEARSAALPSAGPIRDGKTMATKKTLPQREKELQLLLATASGREELRELESRYQATGERLKPAGGSVVTYILVHERVHSMIAG